LVVGDGGPAASLAPAKADTHVAIITSANAHALEQLAARELESQFRRLFVNIHTSLSHQPTSEAELLILVGSPQTNPHLKRAVGDLWPDCSDQGLVIKSVNLDGRQALVVGGGSPVATLWAVYELGQRYGVRYLLRDDVYPQKKCHCQWLTWTSPLNRNYERGSGVPSTISPWVRNRGVWQTTSECYGSLRS
jgi:alpha-glucuronidase